MKLYPFQEEGVANTLRFLSKNKSVYNASDPGTGKTIITIKSLDSLKFKKILIICPAIMRLTWEEEYKKWSKSDLKVHVYQTLRDLSGVSAADVLILSYGHATSMYKKILETKWDCVVLDESHYLKSSKAARSKAILQRIWPCVPYRIALSGTPFTRQITDCYTLFSRMLPNTFGTYHEFGETYSNPEYTPWGVKYKGVKNVKQLSELIRKNFFFRYKKEDVLKELPTKVFQKIILPKNYSVKSLELAYKSMFTTERERYYPDIPNEIPAHIQGHLRVQGLLKVDPISEYVVNMLEQEIPVVLFALNTSVLKAYLDKLHEYNPVFIDGTVSGEGRQSAIVKFQNGGTNLFIGQMEASGVGITLTRSSNVVLAQLPWSPAVLDQAISRCHRIGAKSVVNVHYFSVKGSIDSHVTRVLMEKLSSFSQVLG